MTLSHIYIHKIKCNCKFSLPTIMSPPHKKIAYISQLQRMKQKGSRINYKKGCRCGIARISTIAIDNVSNHLHLNNIIIQGILFAKSFSSHQTEVYRTQRDYQLIKMHLHSYHLSC